MRTYRRGETACIWAFIKAVTEGVEGDYESPDEGVTLILTDPDNAIKYSGAMDESNPGKWVFYYTTQSDDVLGWWKAKVTTKDGTLLDAKYVIETEGFKLEA